MKILVQKGEGRDYIGLINALGNVMIWDPAEHDIRDSKADLFIFTKPEVLGFDAVKASLNKPVLFYKCVQPSVFKRECISFETIPPCADLVRYPLEIPDKTLACDIFYLSNWEQDTSILNKIKGAIFRAAGSVPLPIPNYIGRFDSANEVSKYCLSAGVCIDLNLECAFDLARIGARVITNTENDLRIPTFDESNINDVIQRILNEKKPVLNRYENSILTYKMLVEHAFTLLGVK